MYIDKDNPEHVEDRLHIVPGKSQYLFVYPFVKTREWYSRTAEQRQEKWASHVVTRLQSMRNNGAEDGGTRLRPAALSNSVLTARFPSSPSATEYSFT